MLNVCRSLISYIKQFCCQIQSIEQIAPAGATRIEVPTNRLFKCSERVAIYSETGPCEIRTIIGKTDWTKIQLDEPLEMDHPAGSYVQKLLGNAEKELYIKGIHLGPLKTPPPMPCVIVTPETIGEPEAITIGGACSRAYEVTVETWCEVPNASEQNELILEVARNVEHGLWLIVHPLVEPYATTVLREPANWDDTWILVNDPCAIVSNYIYIQDENRFRQFEVAEKDGLGAVRVYTQIGVNFAAGSVVLSSMRHFYHHKIGDTFYSREPWGGSDCSVARLTVTLSEEQLRPPALQYPAQFAN